MEESVWENVLTDGAPVDIYLFMFYTRKGSKLLRGVDVRPGDDEGVFKDVRCRNGFKS